MKYLPESMSRVNYWVGLTLLIPLKLLRLLVDASVLECSEADTFYLFVVVAVGGIFWRLSL